jgi:hypothetical protein
MEVVDTEVMVRPLQEEAIVTSVEAAELKITESKQNISRRLTRRTNNSGRINLQ